METSLWYCQCRQVVKVGNKYFTAARSLQLLTPFAFLFLFVCLFTLFVKYVVDWTLLCVVILSHFFTITHTLSFFHPQSLMCVAQRQFSGNRVTFFFSTPSRDDSSVSLIWSIVDSVSPRLEACLTSSCRVLRYVCPSTGVSVQYRAYISLSDSQVLLCLVISSQLALRSSSGKTVTK